jgi:hypothetical protein
LKARLPNNPGQSVTNAAEQIAAEVISSHRLPTPLVWIEHYEDGARGSPEDPHTFDLVLFSSYEPPAHCVRAFILSYVSRDRGEEPRWTASRPRVGWK